MVQDWFPLVQEDGRWSRTGSCWYLLVQESGRWFRTGSCWCLLVQEGDSWCRKAVAGAGQTAAGAELVIAATGRSPVQGVQPN